MHKVIKSVHFSPRNSRCKFFALKITYLLSIVTSTCFSQPNSFPPSGNVGIGTTITPEKLTVDGNIQLSGSLVFPSASSSPVIGNPNYGPYIHMFGNSVGNSDQAGGAHFIANSSVNASAAFMVWDYNNSNYNQRLVLRSASGFMGLGVGNPAHKLHVVGNTAVEETLIVGDPLYSSGHKNLAIRYDKTTDNAIFSSASWGSAWTSVLINPLSTSEAFGLGIGVSSATDARLKVKGRGTTNTTAALHTINQNNESLLFVRDDGNVGIGTETPQAKLAVNGDIFSKKIKVIQTGWPDYVFRSDYKLLKLQEVKYFIEHNSHLPGVPSATMIEKDGLDLGELQAVLLKKIEELTLYVIQQNEITEKQAKQLLDQQKRLADLEEQLRSRDANRSAMVN